MVGRDAIGSVTAGVARRCADDHRDADRRPERYRGARGRSAVATTKLHYQLGCDRREGSAATYHSHGPRFPILFAAGNVSPPTVRAKSTASVEFEIGCSSIGYGFRTKWPKSGGSEKTGRRETKTGLLRATAVTSFRPRGLHFLGFPAPRRAARDYYKRINGGGNGTGSEPSLIQRSVGCELNTSGKPAV